MSFQNRCIIPTANGLTALSIPLRGGRENGLPVGEVQIDNSQRWQVSHWRTITSAYNRSAFFEYYQPSLAGIYETRFDKLWDWDLALLKWIIQQLNLSVTLGASENVGRTGEPKKNKLTPRNFQQPESIPSYPVYTQVFMERIGFQPNVSVMDLLFCMGNNSGQLLQTML